MWKENLYQPVEILLMGARYISDWRAPAFFFRNGLYSGRYRKFCCQFRKWREEHHNYCAADLCLIPPNRVHLFLVVHIVVICLSGSRRIM